MPVYDPEFFNEKCRENNLKVTPQRVAIYKELLKSIDHPNAEAIHSKLKKIFPNISLDTVNRNLLALYKVGIIDTVLGFGEPKRYDGNQTPHHHFRCIKCNKLFDLFNIRTNNTPVPKEVKKDFIILKQKVYFEGLCKPCNEL